MGECFIYWRMSLFRGYRYLEDVLLTGEILAEDVFLIFGGNMIL